MDALQPIKPATFLGRMGLARADITPPAGIYSRAWGAAAHDIADGVHLPLTTTALALLPDDGPTRMIVGLDAAWIGGQDDWHDFLEAIAHAAGIPGQINNILLSVSHTHAAPPLDRSRADLPGGELIAPYLNSIREAFIQVTQAAIANAVDAQLSVDVGSCTLATNRDLLLDDERHFACGFNPRGTGDDTLLVGRITERSSGRILGTIVNYACHPTTLAWENTLISPDYVGTLRQVVEAATDGAPCLFLQGASGELSARDCHQGHVEVAERQGRQVGYAALSTLMGMVPAGEQLNYAGIKESGARLAYWRPGPLEATPRMRKIVTQTAAFAMPIKPEWPTLAEFERLWAESEDRVMKERYLRRMGSRQRVGDGTHTDVDFTFWRLGEIIIVTTPNEMYSEFQLQLRAAFPDEKLIVCNLTNGSAGYVVPGDLYDGDLYQADLTPYAPDCLAGSIAFAKDRVGMVLG